MRVSEGARWTRCKVKRLKASADDTEQMQWQQPWEVFPLGLWAKNPKAEFQCHHNALMQ